MDRDYIRSHASTARQQVLRCRSVTEQFLRMARGQPGAAQAVDVADAAAAAARLVEPSAHAAGVSIRLADIPPGLRVHADRGELQDALVNLVLNAAQACAAGGEVRLDAALADAGRIAIHVTDDGCGIAPELQARIFEPFFSARSSGTGLGLFLSLNFARRCGGDIVVQSVPGRGATFSLVLPAASEAKARAIEVKVVA